MTAITPATSSSGTMVTSVTESAPLLCSDLLPLLCSDSLECSDNGMSAASGSTGTLVAA